MSEVIVVTSGKGGVGKTTTTANIGTGLAKLGKKVVMIDTDTGLRNLDVVLGLENRIVYNLVDVVEGNCRLKQAMIADKRCPNLFLLPTAQTRDKSAVTPEQMIKVIDEIKNDPEGFDYIILDCPAGIEQGFQNAIAGADRALVVTTPEVSAIRDADRIVGLLDAHGLQNHEDLIVNRIRMDMVNRGEMMSIDDVNDILKLSEGRWQIEECFRIMKTDFSARPVYLQDENRIKAHFLICFLSLTIYRYLEKKLNLQYTCEELLDTLKAMNFAEIQEQGFIPLYKREKITDALHETCGFRTDYQFITKSKMKTIQKKSKGKE